MPCAARVVLAILAVVWLPSASLAIELSRASDARASDDNRGDPALSGHRGRRLPRASGARHGPRKEPALAALSQGAAGLASDRRGLRQRQRVARLSAGSLVTVALGAALALVAVAIHWFNEERTARTDALLARGLAEVLSVEADRVNKANRGSLVHVQGRVVASERVQDPQFREAILAHHLKLQATVEVFQWVQTSKTWWEGRMQRSQPRFHTEWSTQFLDSSRFRKPSPENPRPPAGLCLGTGTQVCGNVRLGGFSLSGEMVGAFQGYQPAMHLLPSKVTAAGMVFTASDKDGYYHARPSAQRGGTVGGVPSKQEVGDLRVRFFCVPESEATVVAVQCGGRDGLETFVPYRPVPLGCWLPESRAKQLLVEEGLRPQRELRRETSCCAGGCGYVGCFCCPCSTIACICAQDVATDEICYVSDRVDPPEKAFRYFAQRSPLRVWNFRLLGLAAMFGAAKLCTAPWAEPLRVSPLASALGGAGGELVMSLALAVAGSAAVVAAAASVYRPRVACLWICLAGLAAAAPLLAGALRTGASRAGP